MKKKKDEGYFRSLKNQRRKKFFEISGTSPLWSTFESYSRKRNQYEVKKTNICWRWSFNILTIIYLFYNQIVVVFSLK